ncbi:hypothetical protein B0I73DRAFT_104928, partial [Yarrowia lipolytica]
MKLPIIALALLLSSVVAEVTEDQAVLDTLTAPSISTSNPAANALLDLLQEQAGVLSTKNNGAGNISIDRTMIIGYASNDPNSQSRLPGFLRRQQMYGQHQWESTCGPEDWRDIISLDNPQSVKEAYDWYFYEI